MSEGSRRTLLWLPDAELRRVATAVDAVVA